MRQNFFTLNLSISGNFQQLWFLWQKRTPHQDEAISFYTGSIHFRQFPATLVFVAEKPPPHLPRMSEIFLNWIYPFQAISSNFGFCGRKAPAPQDEAKFFYTGSIHFRQFPATLVFVAEKPPPRMREIFLQLNPSISGNLQPLWFLWQESPPPSPGWGKFFLHWIYPFQAISSNFGFCGRKDPPPRWGKIFLHRIYPFQAISSNFSFCGRKDPHPQDGRNFFKLNLSISGNFQQLWFLWQKSPLPCPPRMRQNFLHRIYPFQAISSNFGFCGRKATPTSMRENFFTLDLSISVNFQQLWFLWQKRTPPPGWGKNFLHWIYLCQPICSHFGFCGRKAHTPPRMRQNFLHWIYPFQAISSNFGFCGRKAPPLPLGWGKIFLHWIYPFQAISSNFGFCGRKPPQDEAKIFSLNLSISGNFHPGQLWFLWQKRFPTMMRQNLFTPDLSISGNFQQLWFLWQKRPPLPRMRENFFTLNLSISGNFQQLWFLWQKSPPPSRMRQKFFLHQIYPFQAISSNFGFCGRKVPPP